MIITDEMLESLRSLAKARLSEHRYLHTLGVEREAAYLSSFFMPEREPELRACALLHDITKELCEDEHRKLILSCEYPLTMEDLTTKNALHGFSAVGFIKENLPEYSSQDILLGVFNHTLGNENMNLFSTIIFISDYTEEGRKSESCKWVRQQLHNSLQGAKTPEEGLKALYRACVLAINNTVEYLTARNVPVNSRTLLTKKSFLEMI